MYLKELNLLVDQQHQPQQQQQQQGGSNEDKDEKSNLNENLNTSFDERAKMLDDKDIMQNVCLNFEAEEGIVRLIEDFYCLIIYYCFS